MLNRFSNGRCLQDELQRTVLLQEVSEGNRTKSSLQGHHSEVWEWDSDGL